MNAAMTALVVALAVLVPAFANRKLTRRLREREAQLDHLAFHDPLTGLPNRALFLDRLGHAIDLGDRARRPVSVAFLDLDGFKAVNDSLGHAFGDALLVQVAARLWDALGTADTLARIGGDEFAALVGPDDDAATVARRMLHALREPFELDDRTVTVTASIGIATTEPGETGQARASGLLHRADVAMYAVKAAGKDDVLGHSPALDLTTPPGERDLYRAVAAALANGDIRAIYQPVVDPVSGRISILEALARWTHDGAEIPPTTFVPICARSGLSEQLTAVVLEQACAQLAAWNRSMGHRLLRVAVNVSPTEFSDPAMPDRILGMLDRYGLDPGQLAVEMTEIAAGDRPESVIDVMNRLRRSGVRLALDDFGTGYSTLARLSRMPVDTLKIDRTFVTGIDRDPRQREFLSALLELGRHLGMRTVAEGVERAGQLRVLQELGCDLVQGHLIARPASAADLTPLVVADRPILPGHLLPAEPRARYALRQP